MTEDDYHKLQEMAVVFKALGDYSRLLIIGYLASAPEGYYTVTTLSEKLDISQPAVSQHLKILASIGLVKYKKNANFRFYSIDLVRFSHLRDQFLAIYDLAFQDCHPIDA
jgi:DNA-binding transcriptional ArsR family regulator